MRSALKPRADPPFSDGVEALELRHGSNRTPLVGEEVLIGRARECHVVLSGARVSRRHARIQFEAGEPRLEDLGSRNGVLLNALRIGAAVRLVPGDRITIGAHEIRVVEARGHRSEPSALRGHVARPAASDDRTTGTGRSLAILEALAEHAMGRGDLAEAQSILAPALDQVLAAARDGHVPDAMDQELAVRAAGRLVAAGDRVRWLRFLLAFHEATEAAPQDAVLDLLGRHREVLAAEAAFTALLRKLESLGLEGAARGRVDRLRALVG